MNWRDHVIRALASQDGCHYVDYKSCQGFQTTVAIVLARCHAFDTWFHITAHVHFGSMWGA